MWDGCAAAPSCFYPIIFFFFWNLGSVVSEKILNSYPINNHLVNKDIKIRHRYQVSYVGWPHSGAVLLLSHNFFLLLELRQCCVKGKKCFFMLLVCNIPQVFINSYTSFHFAGFHLSCNDLEWCNEVTTH